jgi:hypothetical protein
MKIPGIFMDGGAPQGHDLFVRVSILEGGKINHPEGRRAICEHSLSSHLRKMWHNILHWSIKNVLEKTYGPR